MLPLWRPPIKGFPTISIWLASALLPAGWMEDALRFASELRTGEQPQVLLHGDLHHDNVLKSGPDSWLCVDPKGVVGEPAFEAGPLLCNPYRRLAQEPDLPALMAARLSILSEELAIGRERLRDCGILRTLLSAAWAAEDGDDTAYWLRCAAALREA